MNKLLSTLVIAAFATASMGAFAASHGGAMSDKEKAEMAEKCAKMDPAKADDKMKADCKKMMEMKK
jgi:Ni/Co efflux regulator RcnB